MKIRLVLVLLAVSAFGGGYKPNAEAYSDSRVGNTTASSHPSQQQTQKAYGGSAENSGGNSGGNVFESDYWALSVGAPNIENCLVGAGIGGGDDGAGGLIQFGRLNHDCFMNELGEAERHIGTRAKLKCASKHFRNAIAYEVPERNHARREACIKEVTEIWGKEIDYLRAALEVPHEGK